MLRLMVSNFFFGDVLGTVFEKREDDSEIRYRILKAIVKFRPEPLHQYSVQELCHCLSQFGERITVSDMLYISHCGYLTVGRKGARDISCVLSMMESLGWINFNKEKSHNSLIDDSSRSCTYYVKDLFILDDSALLLQKTNDIESWHNSCYRVQSEHNTSLQGIVCILCACYVLSPFSVIFR